MNRTLALLLAVAILLAHMLAIHKNSMGAIAPPYDDAHVAYRVARNLVETGSLAWNQGGAPVESYPSLLWTLIAAAGTRLYLGVTMFCQTIGALSALATVFVLARFSPGRLAGVIAPLLFVVSGSIAAAAASGAETATFALFVAASFLAFERRSRIAFAVALCLTVATRDEGVAFALMLLALELAGAARHRDQARVGLWKSFVPAAAVVAAMTVMRHQVFGTWTSPTFRAWTEPSVARWLEGARYLGDFARASGWTILLVFPLYYLVRGELAGVGRRAMVLSLAYAGLVAYQGGGTGPMFQTLVPMIALLLIAVQEAMTVALDSSRRAWPQVTWTMFLAALALSVLASKHPGNLGLLPLGDWHRRWVENPAPTRLSRNDHLARLGLKEEIEATERLRQLGRFMHEEFEPGVSLLTPWPGGTGYIWRLQTIDALGRTTCLPGETVPRPWSGLQRADVLRLFGLGADYIVPAISWSEKPPSPIELVDDWIVLVDDGPRDPARSAAAREILRAYELITLPVPIAPSATSRWPTRPFHLLRRRALDRAPKLEVALEDGRFRVSVRHGSHKQLVDLCVLLVDARGERWSMLPTGVVRPGATGMMRTSILVFGTGDRAIELATGAIPDDDAFVELRAVLRNPQARAEHPFALASVEVRRPIRR